jgi:hypothetical protein
MSSFPHQAGEPRPATEPFYLLLYRYFARAMVDGSSTAAAIWNEQQRGGSTRRGADDLTMCGGG